MLAQKQIEEIVKRLENKYKPERVILFGSYASGNPTGDSDLDLLVVKNSNMPRYKRAREIRKSLWGITDVPKIFSLIGFGIELFRLPPVLIVLSIFRISLAISAYTRRCKLSKKIVR